MNISQKIEHLAFKKLWKKSIVGLAIVDEDGLFLYANPVFCKITEYSEEELKEKTFSEITHPDDEPYDKAMSKMLVQDKDETEYYMKKRYLTKTGKVAWVTLEVDKVTDENGNFQFFLSQVSELFEMEPSNIRYQTTLEVKKFIFKKWLREYSTWILATLTAIGIILSKVF